MDKEKVSLFFVLKKVDRFEPELEYEETECFIKIMRAEGYWKDFAHMEFVSDDYESLMFKTEAAAAKAYEVLGNILAEAIYFPEVTVTIPAVKLSKEYREAEVERMKREIAEAEQNRRACGAWDELDERYKQTYGGGE